MPSLSLTPADRFMQIGTPDLTNNAPGGQTYEALTDFPLTGVVDALGAITGLRRPDRVVQSLGSGGGAGYPGDINLAGQVTTNGTGDNYSIIQNALNQSATVNPDTFTYGKRHPAVILPPGAVRVVGTLSVPQGGRLVLNGTRLIAAQAGAQVLLNGQADLIGIVGGTLDGQRITGTIGVQTAVGTYDNRIENIFCWNHGLQGILDFGYASYIDRANVQNALSQHFSNASYAGGGAIELRGNDTWLFRCTGATDNAGNTSGSAHLKGAGIYVVGFNNFITNSYGQVSDIGIWVNGATETTIVGCRAELSWSWGFWLQGGSGQITNLRCLRNNRGAVGAGGFRQEGGAEFIVEGLFIKGQDNPGPTRENVGLHINSFTNYPSTLYRSPYVKDCNAAFLETNGGLQSIEAGRRGKSVTLTGATPSLMGQGWLQENFTMGNGSAVTLTNFADGVHGQHIFVRGDGFTTMANNANILTTTGAPKLMAANTIYRLRRETSNQWVEF